MTPVRPNPMLIPRFNIDYNTNDFMYSLINIRSKVDISPVAELFRDSYIEFTNSGRTSLYMILRALNLPDNSNIGVPLYCCPSVFDAIIKAGHKPLFIDIDPKNYTISPKDLIKKIDEIEAVIVVHTFGRPADLEIIQKVAGKKPVIEDCAHALLSRYKGKLAGTIADVGFFSFRTGKYISAGEGGMIITKNKELAARMSSEIERLPKPSESDEIIHSTVTCARSILYHRPWFGLLSLPIGERIEGKIDLMNKYTFKMAQIRKTDLQIILKKMRDFNEKVEMQRKKSEYLIHQLNDFFLQLPIEAPYTYCNYYLFPILFTNKSHRDQVCEKLRKNGVDTAKLFSKTPAIAAQYYEYKGDCPNTEEVADKILVVPNSYALKRKQLDYVSKAIKKNL